MCTLTHYISTCMLRGLSLNLAIVKEILTLDL